MTPFLSSYIVCASVTCEQEFADLINTHCPMLQVQNVIPLEETAYKVPMTSLHTITASTNTWNTISKKDKNKKETEAPNSQSRDFQNEESLCLYIMIFEAITWNKFWYKTIVHRIIFVQMIMYHKYHRERYKYVKHGITSMPKMSCRKPHDTTW